MKQRECIIKKKLILLFVITLFLYSFKKPEAPFNRIKPPEIKISGSSTILWLIDNMGKEFFKLTGIRVNVRGGGTGIGIFNVIRGLSHIGNAYRDIKSKELEKAKNKKVKIKRVKIAVDGLIIIINRNLTGVDSLDVKQITDIYTGKITNWKQVGGPDKRIFLFARDRSSGTGEFFNNFFLKRKTMCRYAMLSTGNADIVTKVSNTGFSIGYISFGYLNKIPDNVKAIPLTYKLKDITGPVEPNKSNVRKGKYPVIRYFYQFVQESVFRTNLKVRDFIRFVLYHPEIVIKNGFLPVNPKTAISDVW